MNFKTIDDIGEVKGKRIIIRTDFNVPVKNGAVVDPFRIERALPTLSFLKERGAILIIVSHIESEESDTLLPVKNCLDNLNFQTTFVTESSIEAIKKEVEKASAGGCLLLENIRRFPGEKDNDEVFAKSLASLAEIYINEAFPVSHRKHASIVGVPKFLPHYAGPLFTKEITELSRAFNPSHPFLFILGGAKFETKEPLIEKFLEIADTIFIGGALGNDFFRARGFDTGGSITSGKIPDEKIANNEKILIPVDVVVRASDGRHVIREPSHIMPQEIVSDAGPETIELLRQKINEAHFVLWNGPLGFYEKGFDAGTKEIARILSKSRAKSLVGGGDTVAAIEELGISERLSFVSTGGGAMLDFLAHGTLPGMEALQD